MYVATDEHHLEEHQHRDDRQNTARSILYGIFQHVGAELSAHETITAEHNEWASIRQLAGEYDTIAQTAQHDRWITLLQQGGLDDETIDELVDTDAYGILTAELRRLEAEGHDIDGLLPRVIRAGGLTDVDDLGSLLRYRVQAVATRYAPPARHRQFIAGLIPRAVGAMDPQMRQALDEREQLIAARAHALTAQAITNPEAWAAKLGPAPADPAALAEHVRQVTVIVTYRDRYAIASSDPLGPIPDRDAQRVDYERARAVVATIHDRGDDGDTPATGPARDAAQRGL